MLEVLALGVGLSPALATTNALQHALESETQSLVKSEMVISNNHVLDDFIMTRQAMYLHGYQTLKMVKSPDGHWNCQVLARIDEVNLTQDITAYRGLIDGPKLQTNLQFQVSYEDALAERDARLDNYAQRFYDEPTLRRLVPIQVLETHMATEPMFRTYLNIHKRFSWGPFFSHVPQVLRDTHLPVVLGFYDASGTPIATTSDSWPGMVYTDDWEMIDLKQFKGVDLSQAKTFQIQWDTTRKDPY